MKGWKYCNILFIFNKFQCTGGGPLLCEMQALANYYELPCARADITNLTLDLSKGSRSISQIVLIDVAVYKSNSLV